MRIYPSNNRNINYINYKGGLSKAIKSEISGTDCFKVQDFLKKEKNINADFANNKLIAWAASNIIKLLEGLKNDTKFKIEFPTDIIVADLNDYNVDNNGLIYGFANFFPCRFCNKNNNIVPGMSIIFNKDFPWEKIDEMSDYDFSKGHTVTDHFLESFIHEFAHIIHEGNMLNRYSAEDVYKKLELLTSDLIVQKFKKEYGAEIEKSLCKYAKESPLDLVACDLSSKFLKNLDMNNIRLRKNPFKEYPYSNNFFNIFLGKKDNVGLITRQIFNGKTNFLEKMLQT